MALTRTSFLVASIALVVACEVEEEPICIPYRHAGDCDARLCVPERSSFTAPQAGAPIVVTEAGGEERGFDLYLSTGETEFSAGLYFAPGVGPGSSAEELLAALERVYLRVPTTTHRSGSPKLVGSDGSITGVEGLRRSGSTITLWGSYEGVDSSYATRDWNPLTCFPRSAPCDGRCIYEGTSTMIDYEISFDWE